MLYELFIQNLAVIETARVNFSNGFSVFTGETGAGKSIVIDAINAILGQRVSKEIVRNGENKATISAMFAQVSNTAKKKLEQYGYELEDGTLIIEREISIDGKNIARIMGRPVTITTLKEIGAELINIHGQHDNQILLSVEKHIDILDKFGELNAIVDSYHLIYKSVVALKKEIEILSHQEINKQQHIEELSADIREIEELDPVVGEDVKLLDRRKELRSFEKILTSFNEAKRLLNGIDEQLGAVELVNNAMTSIEQCSDIYEPAIDVCVSLDSASEELKEAYNAVGNVLDTLFYNETELQEVEERLERINKIKRKYNDIESAIAYLSTASDELENAKGSTARLTMLTKKCNDEYRLLLQMADKITARRGEAGKLLVAAVTSELEFLDMPNVKLQVVIDKVKPNAKGHDFVEFLISTNKGEFPKPIAKIASGGELSRIMLAIKNSLADKDDIQTLIFDEIDTGVSGSAAQKIGLKLKQAAKARQVIAVSHLAQIAALADNHYLIKKSIKDDRTYTQVERLDSAGREEEVARIMGTDVITELTLKNAREMIERNK